MPRLIGECLRDISSLTDGQVVQALRKQVCLLDNHQVRPFGAILVEEGFVTAEQLNQALEIQRSEGSCEVKTAGRSRIFTCRGPIPSEIYCEVSC